MSVHSIKRKALLNLIEGMLIGFVSSQRPLEYWFSRAMEEEEKSSREGKSELMGLEREVIHFFLNKMEDELPFHNVDTVAQKSVTVDCCCMFINQVNKDPKLFDRIAGHAKSYLGEEKFKRRGTKLLSLAHCFSFLSIVVIEVGKKDEHYRSVVDAAWKLMVTCSSRFMISNPVKFEYIDAVRPSVYLCLSIILNTLTLDLRSSSRVTFQQFHNDRDILMGLLSKCARETTSNSVSGILPPVLMTIAYISKILAIIFDCSVMASNTVFSASEECDIFLSFVNHFDANLVVEFVQAASLNNLVNQRGNSTEPWYMGRLSNCAHYLPKCLLGMFVDPGLRNVITGSWKISNSDVTQKISKLHSFVSSKNNSHYEFGGPIKRVFGLSSTHKASPALIHKEIPVKKITPAKFGASGAFFSPDKMQMAVISQISFDVSTLIEKALTQSRKSRKICGEISADVTPFELIHKKNVPADIRVAKPVQRRLHLEAQKKSKLLKKSRFEPV